MEKNKLKFNVFSKEQYDKIVEELLEVPTDWSPEKISKLVSEKFSLTFIPGQPLEKEVVSAFPFYRIRVWNEDDQPIIESNPSEYSYPPDKEDVKMGRANREKMQVLYGSGDPHTPFHELKERIIPGKSIIYFTKWGIKPEAENIIMRSMFYGIPFEGKDDYASIMAKALDEGITKHFKNWPENIREQFLYGQKKYNELYCIDGKEYYHVTSSMVYDHFNADSKQKLQIPIITYPSVAKQKDSVNFVVKKEFVDKFMYIKEVKKIVVREYNDESIDMTLLSKGLLVDDKIVWQTIKTELEKIDFANAKAVFNGDEKSMIDLKPEDRITTCCKKHGITLEQFFEKSNQTPEKVMDGFNNTDLGSFEGEFPIRVQRAIVAPTSGSVYLASDINENKKISHFIVPFTYTLQFQNI